MAIHPDFRALSACFEAMRPDQKDLMATTVHSVFSRIPWERWSPNTEMISLFINIRDWKKSDHPALKKAYRLFFKELIGKVIEGDYECGALVGHWRRLVEQYPDDLKDKNIISEIVELNPQQAPKIDADLLGFFAKVVEKSEADLKIIPDRSDVRRLFGHFLSAAIRRLNKKFYKHTTSALVGPRKKIERVHRYFLESKERQVDKIATLVASHRSLDAVLEDTCNWRSECALLQLEPDWQQFGRKRREEFWSRPHFANGEHLVPKLEQLILESPENFDPIPIFIGRHLESPPDRIENQIQQRTIKGKAGDSEIPLTRLLIAKELKEKPQEHRTPYFLKLFCAHTEYCLWLHTAPKNIDRAMDRVKELYDKISAENDPDNLNFGFFRPVDGGKAPEASDGGQVNINEYGPDLHRLSAGAFTLVQRTKKPEVQVDKVLDLLARMHWWFCHACPYNRGSAAIMEAIAEGILKAKGIDLKPTTLIDIEALTEPSEDAFASRYRSFFNVSSTLTTPYMSK